MDASIPHSSKAALERSALIVIDVQQAFDDPVWGKRNNVSCEQNIGRLIAEWRERGRPIVFVRHDSTEQGSPLRPGAPGNDFKEVVAGEPDLLVVKHVNSAFYGSPDLDQWLRKEAIDSLVICGITTDHCCSTTARMAENLGYRVRFVGDATHTFERVSRDGTIIPPEVVQAVSEATLAGEFAEIVDTVELL